MKHLIPRDFRKRQVRIDLAGVGGTGSLLLPELARLNQYLLASGHPGLALCAWDPDRVSEANVGRGLFRPVDIGCSKAAVLITAVNATYGTCWYGLPRVYGWPCWNTAWIGEPPDILITAVDSLRVRATLYAEMRTEKRCRPPRYWLDCGNDAETGQVILGEPEWDFEPDRFDREGRERLRHVVDVFPRMLEQALAEEEEPESCDLMTALDRQALTINRHMATWAYELLWQLFRHGGLDFHGVFVNARTGRVNPVPVGPRPPAPPLPEPPKPKRTRRALAGAAK